MVKLRSWVVSYKAKRKEHACVQYSFSTHVHYTREFYTEFCEKLAGCLPVILIYSQVQKSSTATLNLIPMQICDWIYKNRIQIAQELQSILLPNIKAIL